MSTEESTGTGSVRLYTVMNRVPFAAVETGEVYLHDGKLYCRGHEGEPKLSARTKVFVQNRGWAKHCEEQARRHVSNN